jgi:hypothetical protein
MPARTAFCMTLVCILSVIAPALSAAPEDCTTNGGQATCTPPIPVWKHSLCDDVAAFLVRSVVWCRVMGGVWHGPYAPVVCEGADSDVSNDEIYPYALAFEKTVHNTQQCPVSVQDSGWLQPGQSISSWNCWSGGPVFQNGAEVSNLREMLFTGQSFNASTGQCEGNWSERVIARRDLRLGCPDGYTLRIDANGQQECFSLAPPSCQISLSGFPAEVEPGKTTDNLVASVSCTGRSPAGVGVTLVAEVTANSGGHQHDDEVRHTRHMGQLGSLQGMSTENGRVLNGVTDADGKLYFSFTAPAPAGDHSVTAQCADSTNPCGMAQGAVWVGIKGLQPIGTGSWKLVGSKPEHPDNRYLTVPAYLVLQQLANYWRQLYVPFGPVFFVNDASLERGGLFDCCEIYKDRNNVEHDRKVDGWWTPPHSEHRRGTEVDINGIRREDEEDFEKYMRDELGANARIHDAGTGRHYHVRLMGVAK